MVEEYKRDIDIGRSMSTNTIPNTLLDVEGYFTVNLLDKYKA